MTFDRRQMLNGTLGAGAAMAVAAAAGPAAIAGARTSKPAPAAAGGWGIPASAFGLQPDSGIAQSGRLQKAIDAAAARNQPLLLTPGVFRVADIDLRPGTKLIGVPGATVLQYSGGRAFLSASAAAGIRLEGLVIDGAMLGLSHGRGLLALRECAGITIRDLTLRRSLLHGLYLRRVSGSVTDCNISQVRRTGLRSIDAAGVEIHHNTVTDCDDNGIQVWRSAPGEDGTIIAGNRIARIKARSGGSGQYGNAINVFRAGSVLIANNRITDCAYSAIRGNAASNIQMTGNSCARLGEVALYAEFGFEGALIANNLVDGAASGIEVTNFNEGGRLAVVQGNIIRNLHRREDEPVDKRGDGIGVEADAVVTGNVVENAPGMGIAIGWGRYMRDVTATNNLVRNARIGIGVSSHRAAGSCFIAQNMISGASNGAIRAMKYARAVGPDLARSGQSGAPPNIHVTGNFAV